LFDPAFAAPTLPLWCSAGAALRRSSAEMFGSLPPWVSNCLLRHRFAFSKKQGVIRKPDQI